jgi:hypothetical protein
VQRVRTEVVGGATDVDKSAATNARDVLRATTTTTTTATTSGIKYNTTFSTIQHNNISTLKQPPFELVALLQRTNPTL